MDEVEARELEEQLRSALSDGGLDWVVQQVDELVSEGVFEVMRKQKHAPAIREEVKRPSDTRRGDSSVRPYTATERVELLLNSARRALADDERLESAVTQLLLQPVDDEKPRRGRLEFFDERSERVVREVDIDISVSRADTLARRRTAQLTLDQLAAKYGIESDAEP
jgi:hypothetical protein